MHRRDFLIATAAASAAPQLLAQQLAAAEPQKSSAVQSTKNAPETATCCGPGYASPQEAAKAPPEKLLYTLGLYVGTPVEKPDYLATIDVDPRSPTYLQVIHRLPMPFVGDELHHFGWNACSSCHGDAKKTRRYLVIPGQRSSRIHIVDTADPRAPKMHKVISPATIKAETNLSAPHTVHCAPDGRIIISMLGDAEGARPAASWCSTRTSISPATGRIRPPA